MNSILGLFTFATKKNRVHDLLTITWDVGKGIPLGSFTLRFYQLLFASGFVLGYFIMRRFLRNEGHPDELLDKLLTYMVIATIVGARLGHVFFYQWDYYSQNPVEIFKVWEGGLASHGAAIAIIISMYLFSKRESKRSTLWILDKVVVTVALAACLIRMGNFFNSEIYGHKANSAIETVYTDLPRQALFRYWEDQIEAVEFTSLGEVQETDSLNYPTYTLSVHFKKGLAENAVQTLVNRQAAYLNGFPDDDKNIIVPVEGSEVTIDFQNRDGGGINANFTVLGVPRYPTQLIEAFFYLIIFFILYSLYQRGVWKKEGVLFGLFLVMLFGFRIGVEFLKVVQVDAEKGMSFNLGQSLSIPLVLAGMFFVFRGLNKKEVE